MTPSARTTLVGYGCLFRRRRPWLSVPCLLRFRPARAPRNIRICDADTGSPQKTRRVRLRLRLEFGTIPFVYHHQWQRFRLSGSWRELWSTTAVHVFSRSRLGRETSDARLHHPVRLLPRRRRLRCSGVRFRSGQLPRCSLQSCRMIPGPIWRTIVSPLQDSDTALPVSPSQYPAPLVPDPAPTSQLSPVPLRVVNALPSIDLFPSYTMSPAHSYYAPATSPITTNVPDTSEYLSPGSPTAMDRFLAGDGDLLLDCSSDLPMLLMPLLPLPASSFPSWLTLRWTSFHHLRLRRLTCLGRAPSMQIKVSQCRGLHPSSWIVYRVVNTGWTHTTIPIWPMWIRPTGCSCITHVSWSTSGRPNRRVCWAALRGTGFIIWTGVIGSDVPWLECPACNDLTWVITVTE